MIYFVLPVYNEAKNISKIIVSLRRAMAGQAYQVIAVNDGSRDGSLAKLNSFSGKNLAVVNYKINMNVGAVFSTGIAAVLARSKDDSDIMIIMEGDQTSSVGLLPKLIKAIAAENQDVVIASRYQYGGSYKNFPLSREVYSRGANALMRFCFPIKRILDYTIFFRAYRVKLLRRAVKTFGLFGLIQSKGFVANAELLVKLSLLTKRIREVPFTYNYAKKIGKSKLNVLRTVNEYFVLIGYLKRIFAKWEQL